MPPEMRRKKTRKETRKETWEESRKETMKETEKMGCITGTDVIYFLGEENL